MTGEGKPVSVSGRGPAAVAAAAGAAGQEFLLALPSVPQQQQQAAATRAATTPAAAVRPSVFPQAIKPEEGSSSKPRRVHLRTARGTFARKQHQLQQQEEEQEAHPLQATAPAIPESEMVSGGGSRGRYGGGGHRGHHGGRPGHVVGQAGVDESLLEKYRSTGTMALMSKPEGRDEEKRNVHRVREYWLEHEAVKHLGKLLALKVCVGRGGEKREMD